MAVPPRGVAGTGFRQAAGGRATAGRMHVDQVVVQERGERRRVCVEHGGIAPVFEAFDICDVGLGCGHGFLPFLCGHAETARHGGAA